MKALVTGGAGFIGSHIAERLVNTGWSVVILDDLSSGNLANLDHIADGLEIIIGDVRDTGPVKKSVTGVDVIFHEAAIPSVPKSIDDPIEKGGAADFSSNLKSNSLDPEEIYIRTQKVSLMRKVMGKLTPKYRLMIELRYFEELSYEEIARELEIPLGTVKAQLFRAKEILYTLLKKPGAQAFLDMSGRARARKRG